MTTNKRILPALVVSLFAAGSTSALAVPFTNVYSFGDSLSDVGYYRPILRAAGLPDAIVSQIGSFTTNPDPIWVELVAQFYGVPANASNVSGGTMYAQGGARVVGDSPDTPTGAAQRSAATQVTEFLSGHGGTADPNALYTMWIGANDLLQNSALLSAGQITVAQFQTNLQAAATAEIGQVGRLAAAGAKYIVVVGLPDVGKTPSAQAGGPVAAAGATQAAAGYNTVLWAGLAQSGLRVIPVDSFSLLNEVIANPAAYGITNTTSPACGVSPLTGSSSSLYCLPNSLVAPNANNTYVFADSIHPTGASGRIFAGFIEGMIEGPYNYSQLAEAALRTRTLHVQGVSDGLNNGFKAELGAPTVFVSGGGGHFDVDTSPGNAGITNRNEAYTVGVTVRASDAVTVGAAFGQTRDRGRFGMDMGGFNTRDNNYSLFAGLQMHGFYANGVATMANLKYSEINRNIFLGPAVRTANASTSGSNASFFFEGGYDFALGRFLIGPVVGATSQDIEVSGFDEANAGSANLRIFNQKRRSTVWSGGLRASTNVAGWTPWIRWTADKETEDDPRFVTAMPLSLAATGNQYDIPAWASDSSYSTFSAGVRGWIARNVGLGVSYYKVSGRSGSDEWGAGAVLSLKF